MAVSGQCQVKAQRCQRTSIPSFVCNWIKSVCERQARLETRTTVSIVVLIFILLVVMATFFQSVRQGFGRGGNRNNNNNNNNANNPNNNANNNAANPRPNPNAAANPPPAQYPLNPPAGTQPTSTSTSNPTPASVPASSMAPEGQQPESDSVKYFFQEKYAVLNVKGNFLTLCACPKNVELGEWLAHQMVEQYRLLQAMLLIVQETNTVTGLPVCNDHTCPTMTAGNLTYTWLIDGKAAKISAPKFINRVERWIVSKIHDPVMFPTTETADAPGTFTVTELRKAMSPNEAANAANGQDWIGKSSGFPPSFYKDCQGLMKQMFRCYGHLYHGHWENPFYHINKHEILNMCFVHFVTVAKYYRLVADKEMEPMQPLIDLYIRLEKIPPEALAGHWVQGPPRTTN